MIFLQVLFFVKVVTLERTDIRICLVITLVVDTLKCVGAWFALLCFKIRRVNLKVHLTTLCKMLMILNLMWSIAFYIPRTLKVAGKSGMTPLLAILVLWNTKIHICITNSGNEATDVEAMIDECLGH